MKVEVPSSGVSDAMLVPAGGPRVTKSSFLGGHGPCSPVGWSPSQTGSQKGPAWFASGMTSDRARHVRIAVARAGAALVASACHPDTGTLTSHRSAHHALSAIPAPGPEMASSCDSGGSATDPTPNPHLKGDPVGAGRAVRGIFHFVFAVG